MITIVENKGAGIKNYICDKPAELSDIDIRTTAMGSTCFAIQANTMYILNGDKEWIPVTNLNSTGGGGSSILPGSASELTPLEPGTESAV